MFTILIVEVATPMKGVHTSNPGKQLVTFFYLLYQSNQRLHHISLNQLFTMDAVSYQTQISVDDRGLDEQENHTWFKLISHLRAPNAASRTSQTGSSSKLVNLTITSARTRFLSDVESETNWATEWQAHCLSVSLSLYNYQRTAYTETWRKNCGIEPYTRAL